MYPLAFFFSLIIFMMNNIRLSSYVILIETDIFFVKLFFIFMKVLLVFNLLNELNWIELNIHCIFQILCYLIII